MDYDYTNNVKLLRLCQTICQSNKNPKMEDIEKIINLVNIIKPTSILGFSWINVHNAFKSSVKELIECKLSESAGKITHKDALNKTFAINHNCNFFLEKAKKITNYISMSFEQLFVNNLINENNNDSNEINKIKKIKYDMAYKEMINIIDNEKAIINPNIINKILYLSKQTPTFYLSNLWLQIEDSWDKLCKAKKNYIITTNDSTTDYYLNIYNSYLNKCIVPVNATFDIYLYLTRSLIKIIYEIPVDKYEQKTENKLREKIPPFWNIELTIDDIIDNDIIDNDIINNNEENEKKKIKNKQKKQRKKISHNKKKFELESIEWANFTTDVFKMVFDSIYINAPEEIKIRTINLFFNNLSKNNDYTNEYNILWSNIYKDIQNLYYKDNIIIYESFINDIESIINKKDIEFDAKDILKKIVLTIEQIQPEKWYIIY